MPDRRRLPPERRGTTFRFELGGIKGYCTVNVFDDGLPGEIFLRFAKAGSTMNGLLDGWAIMMSLALQHGVPLQTIVDKMTHTRFPPDGWTDMEDVRYATSIFDLLGRWLVGKFLPSEVVPAPAPPMVTVPPMPEACSDAPACERCGHLMRRMGSNNCFVCPNCTATSGSCGG